MPSSLSDSRAHMLELIDGLVNIRLWQDANLPVYGSFIGFDLVLFLSRSRFLSAPYSLKDVFHSLRFSEGALRIFIRRLEKDGWIRLETWPGDRRNKKIIVEDALIDAVEDYFRRLAELPLDPDALERETSIAKVFNS